MLVWQNEEEEPDYAVYYDGHNLSCFVNAVKTLEIDSHSDVGKWLGMILELSPVNPEIPSYKTKLKQGIDIFL